jgi:replicative DNA helicase
MSTVPFSRHRTAPLPADIAKKLPSNDDAERSILGAILLDNAALPKVFDLLSTADFFRSQHSLIYSTMLTLHEDQLPIDLISLTEELGTAGKLEAAGGAAYISALVDGLPRVSNVAYHAEIVKQKARLRGLIHLANKIQSGAIDETGSAEQLLQSAEIEFKELSAPAHDVNPAVVVGFQEMISRECKPIEYAIEPLLSRRGTGELYGWRGTGKSFVSTDMAVKIAVGADSLWGGHRGAGGHWPISRPFRQLYVYGEMDESQIQERIREIARMYDTNVPTDQQLGLMCMDFQKNWRPKLSSARDRKYIEDKLIGDGYEGIWFDNLSTLWPASQDAEGERDAILADWYTDLNQRGIWVIWLHHAGKSGLQRGGSEKEDMLSFVMRLRRPSNYKPEEQLRVEVELEKTRHKCNQPRMLMPFEIQLTKDAPGKLFWVTRPAQAAQRAAAFEMFKNKMPTMLVAQEVGVSRATAYRWAKDFAENPDPIFHLEPEKD